MDILTGRPEDAVTDWKNHAPPKDEDRVCTVAFTHAPDLQLRDRTPMRSLTYCGSEIIRKSGLATYKFTPQGDETRYRTFSGPEHAQAMVDRMIAVFGEDTRALGEDIREAYEGDAIRENHTAPEPNAMTCSARRAQRQAFAAKRLHVVRNPIDHLFDHPKIITAVRKIHPPKKVRRNRLRLGVKDERIDARTRYATGHWGADAENLPWTLDPTRAMAFYNREMLRLVHEKLSESFGTRMYVHIRNATLPKQRLTPERLPMDVRRAVPRVNTSQFQTEI